MKRSKLKKRLRKKNHLGEFQVFGFEVWVNFKSNLSENGFRNFLDEFIEEIEENKLSFGGGGDSAAFEGFVTASQNYQSPTIEQKENIKNWLETRPEISKCEVGNFKDAWYD